MNDYIYESDTKEMSDHILLVNLNTIKEEIANRKQDLCNKFYEGQAIAITTGFRDEGGSYKVYPAWVSVINKASIKVRYTTDRDYNPVKNSFDITKLISSEHIKNGYVLSAMPSRWIN